MLPTYPTMAPNSAPYQYQSTRPDPSNTDTCKPVAIISHNNQLTLITCLQTNHLKDNQFVCQHQKHLSDITGVTRTTLIQDLERKACCVYTLNPEDASAQEQMAEFEASGMGLPKLRPEDLEGLMEIEDEQVNQSKPDDLDLHHFDEKTILQLLPQKAIVSTLSFSQQGASTSTAGFNQTASTSTASLDQRASTSRQAPTATALLNQPARSLALTQEKIRLLSSLLPYQKRVIYCVLEIFEKNQAKSFTKWELIDLMKEKYISFDNVRSDGIFTHAFARAASLELIQKSGHHSSAEGIRYTLEKYGSAAFQFLKQDIASTLALRTSATTHSNDGT